MIKNKISQYRFKNQQLLDLALTHRSSLNENKIKYPNSNERLEFLGDAVLELWTSQYLYLLFPQKNEGELTNLRSLIVRTENLAQIATNLKIGELLHLSRGESSQHGRENPSILADSLEAVIGAIFLDSDYKTVSTFLSSIFKLNITLISQKQNYKDAKSFFQEIAQAQEGITPNYKIISETGPDHQKIFVCAVFVGSKKISQGDGNSKQKAEESAANNAILCYNPSHAKNQT